MALKQKKQISADAAQARLEQLCVRGEQCRYDLAQKLYKWGISQPDSRRILEEMSSNKFYDDARYAMSYARDKALYSKWGKRKIVMGLRLKRIDSLAIKEAIDDIDESEYRERMLDVLTAKARSLKEGNSFEGRTKLYRFGVMRGYEPSLVVAAIRSGVLFGNQ